MIIPIESSRENEGPISEPFWDFESNIEAKVVRSVLWRGFPETISILASSLEEADPLDVVYPDNPGEYSDVVSEIVVLLSPVHGELRALSFSQIDEVVREGLSRCFGEPPDDKRVKKCVDLILVKADSRATGSAQS